MFVALLLLSSATLAGERPVLDVAADDVCPPRGVRAGIAITPACDGILVSMARAKWYAEMAVYADAEADLRRIDVATMQVKLDTATDREAWYRARYDEAAARPPIHPSVWFGAGVVGGITVTVAGAYAVSLVAQ
jgi:hypothetical protein